MSSATDDTPDPIQPEVPTVKDREQHGKSPDLEQEELDHRTAQEEELVRRDDGGGGRGPEDLDRDAVPDAEE